MADIPAASKYEPNTFKNPYQYLQKRLEKIDKAMAKPNCETGFSQRRRKYDAQRHELLQGKNIILLWWKEGVLDFST